MRYLYFLLLILSLANASFAQRTITVRQRHNPKKDAGDKDSVVYYEENIAVRQKSYKKSLEGKWEVVSLRRQQKAGLEMMRDVFIVFSADSSFSGKAPCNTFGGVYILKGTGINFSKIISTMVACDELEQEKAFLDLLQHRVSEITVTQDTLLLRDGASNIVFECKRPGK